MNQPVAAASPKKSSGCLIFAVIIVLLGFITLVVLAAGGFAAYKYRDKIKALANSSAPATTPGAASTPAAANQPPVKVELKWDKPVDLDLEIWDEPGESLKARSFNWCGKDSRDGKKSGEFFVFDRYDTQDFSSGSYVISVFYKARKGHPEIDRVKAKLVVVKPDGSTVERDKVISWEEGKDQWHAIRVNAVTGEVVDIDAFVRTKPRDANASGAS